MHVRALALCACLVGCGGSTAAETPPIETGVVDSGTSTTDSMTPVVDTATPSDASDAGSCACATASVEWELNGGRVAFTDRSAVKGCDQYTQVRVPMVSMMSGSCSARLELCARDATVSVSDLNSVLANADVKAAIAAAPVLYGSDPRAFDGSVLQVRIDGKLIEIGDACGSATGCTPPPAGVLAFREVLRNIDREQESSACAALK